MPSRPTATQIASAARRLLDRGGPEALTMRRVAQAVGITPMAIYRHYPDRASLLNALADQGFEELAARLAGARLPAGRSSSNRFSCNIEKRLLKMFDIFLEHALENPRLFELMFLKPRTGARRYPLDFKAGKSPTARLLAKVVEEGMQRGHFRKDDAWEITFEMGALSHGLIALYIGGRIDATPSQFRAMYGRSFRRLVNGIRA